MSLRDAVESYKMRGDNIGKIMVLTFKDTEEKAIEKIISALSDSIQFEAIQPPLSRSFFSGAGNKAAPTPGTERRGRHKPYPSGIWYTFAPSFLSGAGIFTRTNF